MKKKLAVLMIGALGATGVATKASTEGWGVPKPISQPQSIREGSMKGPLTTGYIPTRYFTSGGIHRGK